MKRVAIAAAILLVAGCSSIDDMSRADKGTAIGAGAGGVLGNVVTGGGVLGTVGGAAVGGLVGHEVGKDQDKKKQEEAK